MGNEGGVSGVTDIDLAGLKVAGNVLEDALVFGWGFGVRNCYTYLAAEAVANSADLLHAESLTYVLEGGLDNRVDVGGLVVGQPGGQISLARFHSADLDLVALEKIRDDGQVAIVGKLIGEELGVAEDTEDISQKDNGLVGVLVILGRGNVGFH